MASHRQHLLCLFGLWLVVVVASAGSPAGTAGGGTSPLPPPPTPDPSGQFSQLFFYRQVPGNV